jgi:hypothetical protein
MPMKQLESKSDAVPMVSCRMQNSPETLRRLSNDVLLLLLSFFDMDFSRSFTFASDNAQGHAVWERRRMAT